MAFVLALFILTGVGMAAWGNGADRAWGLMILAFFGGSAVALFAPKGRRDPPQVSTTVVHHGVAQPAVVLPIDRRRFMVRVGVSATWAGVGALLFGLADRMAEEGTRYNPTALRWVGAALFLVFGGFAVLGALRGSGQRLAVLSEGLLLEAGASRVHIPWTAIQRITVSEVHDNEMLAIDFSDPEAVEMGRLARLSLPLVGVWPAAISSTRWTPSWPNQTSYLRASQTTGRWSWTRPSQSVAAVDFLSAAASHRLGLWHDQRTS
jgi:hypothetical protein